MSNMYAQNPLYTHPDILSKLSLSCRDAAKIGARVRVYGLRLWQFFDMLVEQDFKCLICGATLNGGSKTHIDHSHTSGAVRGLLCHICNHGLGVFKDNPDTLRKAAAYLETQT